MAVVGCGAVGRPGPGERPEVATPMVVEAPDPSVCPEGVVERAVLRHDEHDVLDSLEVLARRSGRRSPVDGPAARARREHQASTTGEPCPEQLATSEAARRRAPTVIGERCPLV